MSTSVTRDSYFIRATYPYEDLKPLIDIWAPLCEKMAVYEHNGEEQENVHCHIAIVGFKKTKKQMINYARNTMVSWEGNEDYSCKGMSDDFDRQYVYMTKGIYEPSYLKVYTQEDADEWKRKWVPADAPITVDELHYNACFNGFTSEDWMELMDAEKARIRKNYSNSSEESLEVAMLKWTPKETKKFVYNKVLERANSYISKNVVKVCNTKFFNLQKMLVLTYCFKNNIEPFGRLAGFFSA